MTTRVLLIEKNEKAAATLINYFRLVGVATERVNEPDEALARLSPHAPDLILLSLRPPARDALDFLKTLRRSPQNRRIPILTISSAYRGEPYVEILRTLGSVRHLESPFPMSRLLAAVRFALPRLTTVAMPIHRHLRRAFLTRFTGTHSLHGLSGDRTLAYFEGVPIHLSPGFFHDDFGRFLRHRNLISSEENGCLRADSGHGHDLLVQMGCLDHTELLQEKLLYLSEELIAGFSQPPTAVTEQAFPCPPGIQPLAVNLPEIFYQGYHRHGDLPAFRRQLANWGYRYPAVTGNYYRFINFLTLSAGEKRFLPGLDGKRPLRELLVGRIGLEPLLLTLSALGMLRLSEEPTPATPPPSLPLRRFFNAPPPGEDDRPLENFADLLDDVPDVAGLPSSPGSPGEELPEPEEVTALLDGIRGKNYYEIFGMTPSTFRPTSLRDRYFHFTRRLAPTVLMRLSGEAGLQAQEILADVTTAYNTLADPVKKEAYDALRGSSPLPVAPDRLHAQVQAQAGLAYLERREWGAAEQSLREACNLEPFNGVWLAHLAWALYRDSRGGAGQTRRDKARQTVNRALGLERSAHGHAYKGCMMFDSRQFPEAVDEFREALRLDPGLTLAREGLKQALAPRGGGFFRRLFPRRQGAEPGIFP